MFPILRLSASTRVDRNEIISKVQETCASHSAWITDYHLFSNVAMNIQFEVATQKLNDWIEALTEVGLRFGTRSMEQVKARPREGVLEEYKGTLEITFIHDKPDMRQIIPSVPG